MFRTFGLSDSASLEPLQLGTVPFVHPQDEVQAHGLQSITNLIVRRQMEYGAGMGIPWGISEAAFNARDPEMTYQYSNFGARVSICCVSGIGVSGDVFGHKPVRQ